MASNAANVEIPEHLRKRVEAAADAVGKSTQAFTLEAIEDATVRVESRNRFVDRALRAREDFFQQRAGYAADEVHRYMRQRAQGKNPKKPPIRSYLNRTL